MKKHLILLIGLALVGTVKATVVADVIIEGLPVKVISSGQSYKVFEQYPWEGHSSKYGPKGNRLSPGHGVGVGKNISRSLQVRQGDWIHMPDIGWRQINESSSKKNGIEFFATRRDEYKSKHPRITIDRVVFALPSQWPDHPPYRLAEPQEMLRSVGKSGPSAPVLNHSPYVKASQSGDRASAGPLHLQPEDRVGVSSVLSRN
jgi:hypothetical protein